MIGDPDPLLGARSAPLHTADARSQLAFGGWQLAAALVSGWWQRCQVIRHIKYR